MVRGDAAAAEREFREAARHDEHGWQFTLGQFLVETDAGRTTLATAVVDHVAATRRRDGLDALLLTAMVLIALFRAWPRPAVLP